RHERTSWKIDHNRPHAHGWFTLNFAAVSHLVRGRCDWRCGHSGIATLSYRGRTSAACLRLATYPVVCHRDGEPSCGCFYDLLLCAWTHVGDCTAAALASAGGRRYGVASGLECREYSA